MPLTALSVFCSRTDRRKSEIQQDSIKSAERQYESKRERQESKNQMSQQK